MNLRILHYSDQRSPDLSIYEGKSDLIFTTGDLDFTDLMLLQTARVNEPAYGVLGNHDVGINLEEFGITNVHKNVYEHRGLKIGGFNGCLKYKESEYMYTEEEANVFADTFPYVDILLLHAGPFGMLDDPSDSVHIGSKNIRRYVEEKRPKYVFVGHQYSDGYMEFGNTKIYRTFGARIISIQI